MAITSSQEISPELVLVCPELAAYARRRLPNHPWEPAFPRTQHGVVAPAGNAVHLRSTEAVSATLSDARADSRMGRLRNRRIGLAAICTTAVMVLGVVGLLRSDVSRDEGRSTTSMSLERHLTLLPGSGYVVFPAGNFMTTPSGSRIAFFTLPLRCGGSNELVIEDVPVSGGAIRFTGKALNTVVVHISARLLDRRRVRGFVSASGPRCNSGRVAFSARLS